ncbi:hypothetical protein SCP_0208420 [Sparassis crispa]|uniref:BCD1 alpha/beta domain-containing protein n=1 Tax=Sparassis crispa TaxID=139825 RepID=A0A401GBV5_9APHY|nr:hypothetical protein SCP_0208420 [Sparassis crispa]GBE79642.1 hypothetical protein SCP_0208420 [Sparassis crispa]
MNQYGYMALMDDYMFLEDMGRKVGDWGREIVHGGYTTGVEGARRGRGGMDGRGRGRVRGRGRGGSGAHTRTKRDVLKMQLDFRDIEIEMLPNGMERRTLNQSTWDFKNRTALLTVEFKIHSPATPLAPSSQPDPPYTLLIHRNSLEKSLLSILQTHVCERSKSKKDKAPPSWVAPLVFPDTDVPDGFVPPTCVMRTPIDPLASLSAQFNTSMPRPGHILCAGYYKLDPSQPLSSVLKHKNFVEFPTVEVFEDGAFQGTIVDDHGTVLRDTEEERRPKRRKLNVKEGRNAINGLLGGYGSEEEGTTEELNVLDMLGGYAGSDDEGPGEDGHEQVDRAGALALNEGSAEEELFDEDAEGETDDEVEGDAQNLAALLEQLRHAGALRDPAADGVLSRFSDADEQVDWGESDGDEG